MERLTYDFCVGGNHCYQIKGADNSFCKDVCIEQGYDGCTNFPIKKAFDRLAAYEDTGLEPEEITDIKHILMRREIANITEFDGIPIKRLQELAQVEKDGRLVVLPCKNDTVYTIEEDYFNCGECRHRDSAHYQAKIDRISCDMNNGIHCPFYVEEHKVDGFYVKFDVSGAVALSEPGEFGYEGLEQFCGVDGKVYYTREEAEAALKKREEAGNETD